MIAEYTAGPWEVMKRAGSYLILRDEKDGLLLDFRTVAVAIKEPNARLIAAAPDLLEALQGSKVALEECANILRSSFPSLADNVIGAHLRIVDAALRSALSPSPKTGA